MPTHHPRINITFEPTTAAHLKALAKHEHKSVASFAKELILDALERREDKFFSALAEKRDIKGVQLIKHKDAWK
jgi:predicted DNA-binding protein